MTDQPLTRLVYVDTEFGNLDPRLGDTFEVAWAVDDGPVKYLPFLHTRQHATAEALRINGYWERGLDRYCTDNVLESGVPMVRQADLNAFVRDLTGATIVAENYGIDCAKLLTKLGFEPWHYRKIEVSSVAMLVFDLDRPEGLVKTAGRLRDAGYDIPENDHTAVADVLCLRACYEALRAIRLDGLLPIPGELRA